MVVQARGRQVAHVQGEFYADMIEIGHCPPSGALSPVERHPEGCWMPATDCDLDHTQAWAEGGPTEIGNLAPLCRHDHRLKHQANWQLQPISPGQYTWTSPHGHAYTTTSRPP
jgi:hypothetical protein